METVPAPEAFGTTIFCDDVRMEIGGKLTFVGCYSGKMFIHSGFPVVFPKFCLAISYWQERGKVVRPIRVWVFMPGDPEDTPSIEFGIPDQSVEDILADLESDAVEIEKRAERAFAAVRTQIALVNLNITQPGSIRVRAVRGEQLIRLGNLRVEAAPDTPPPEIPAA